MTAEPLPPKAAPARTRHRLAGWCLVIAATGTPATVALEVLGDGAESSATVIGTITVAALAAARAFMRDSSDRS
ncbi:hypothetical protein Asp14428_33320 [Actinoplanes sp. NBRC 14428]|nr:hypothetical protein Asp14428_33320 [Actinoplanes sp. NBRC 14428]